MKYTHLSVEKKLFLLRKTHNWTLKNMFSKYTLKKLGRFYKRGRAEKVNDIENFTVFFFFLIFLESHFGRYRFQCIKISKKRSIK